MIVMLFVFGRDITRASFDEDVPLDRDARWCCAAFALVMFVLCFTPAPIEPMDLLGNSTLRASQMLERSNPTDSMPNPHS